MSQSCRVVAQSIEASRHTRAWQWTTRVRSIGLKLMYLLCGALVGPSWAQGQVETLRISLESIRILQVPEPPGGGEWDGSILGNIFLGDVRGMYPDIEVCIGSRNLCEPVCVNAQLYADDPDQATVCRLELTGGLPIADLVERAGQAEPERKLSNVAFQVNEFDSTLNARPKRTMATFSLFGGTNPVLPRPEVCTETMPCRVSIPTANGPLVASFTTSYRGVVGTPTATGGPAAPPGVPQSAPDDGPPLYDAAMEWFREKVWGKIKDAAGFRGTVLEGLKDQADVRDSRYLACLRRGVGLNQQGSAFNTTCVGKTGDDAEQCAERILAASGNQHVIGECQQGEGVVGFLANLWKSTCGFVGLTCN